MMRTGIQRHGRTLIAMLSISALFLLSGCCTDSCYKDVLYEFDYPSKASHCPEPDLMYISKRDVDNSTLDPRDGGAGIVERSGGAGIVDRKSRFLVAYCQIKCAEGEDWDENETPQLEWSYNHKYVVASVTCK